MADESSRKRVALGSLKSLNLKEVEQLSRNQLKDVLGGFIGPTNNNQSQNVTYPCKDGMIPCYCNGPEVIFIGCTIDAQTCWDRC